MGEEITIEALLAEGDGVLSRLRVEEQVAEAALDAVRRRIEAAGQVVAAVAAWRALRPTPAAPSETILTDVRAETADHGHHGDLDGALDGLPLRTRVARLLGQDPQRIWRAQEIGTALAAPNLGSLRTSLSQMAHAGVLIKVAAATYRFAGAVLRGG
ncbi:hypothetical protein ITP53_43775 [Nonomuraea sp. K274]|uniref:Uncharacterized protein n=1 Tax=Nonomuraea cypriaca TaxID=1187855 RepID=A0A931F4B2_9ACTN|nr:hypothetical protein [Nonomuraea cypriaca]MBF8192487.1 hypothetical protein [Nonomuraea cypriaca]